MPVKTVCQCCKKYYYVRLCNLQITRFCSRGCAAQGLKRRKEYICQTCNCIFYRIPSREKYYPIKFCSHRCTALSRKGNKAAGWVDGRTVDNDGYYRVFHPEIENSQAKGYILEHRYVMQQELGRLMEENEIVHHINGNKLDNRIGNLELMTRSQHMRLHNHLRKINST